MKLDTLTVILIGVGGYLLYKMVSAQQASIIPGTPAQALTPDQLQPVVYVP